MADDTQAVPVAASPSDAAPVAATPTTSPTAPQAGTDTPDSDVLTAEQARKLIADLRKEAAGYRVKAKALDEKLAAEEAAKLSDAEKATKQAEAAIAQATKFRDALGTAKLENAAIKANALDSDAIVA